MPNHVTNELTCENKTTLDSLAGSDPKQVIDFESLIPMPDILKGEVDEDTKDWARIALGIVNVSTLRQTHRHPADSFRSGDFGAASKALEQSNIIHMMTEGPFPKDFDDERFEQFINCIRALRTCGHASWYEWSLEKWGTKWNAYNQKRVSDTVVRFDTAWSTPLKVLQALSEKYPTETFRLRWADEDFGNNVGDITVKGSDLSGLSGEPLKNGSREAHALALELKYDGEVPEDYKWEDGRLVYVDDEQEQF